MQQQPSTDTESPWARARTVEDLAACSAAWLRKWLPEHPGLCDSRGSDPELDPLVANLAETADAGFLLTAAHPARTAAVVGGRVHRWRAAVRGHVAEDRLLHRLVDAAEESGLLCIVHQVADGTVPDQIAVATADGRPEIVYGPAADRAGLELRWPGLHPKAMAAVLTSREVVLAAPPFGPDGDYLWDVLWEAACLGTDEAEPAPAVCVTCGCCASRRCSPGCSWATTVSSVWLCTGCLNGTVAGQRVAVW